MTPSKYDINVINSAVEEYVNTKKPLGQISDKYNLTYSALRHWIIRLGYKTRKTKDCELEPTKHDLDNIHSAIKEYLSSKKSYDLVGSEFGINGAILRHWLLKLGHKSRKAGEAKYDEKRVKECCDLYLNGYKSGYLAKKYGVAGRTITYWLLKNNIKPKRYNETLGVTNEIKQKAIDLYVNEKLNCCEIAKRIGHSNRSILDWIKSVQRSNSEIAIDRIIKRGQNHNYKGIHGSLKTQHGEIFYDSTYERDRIHQHLQNDQIRLLTRCKDKIQYNCNGIIKYYNPDLYIEYNNGNKIVEEIKPFTFINKFSNRDKFSSAKKFYKNSNIIYKVITEIIIYGKRAA